MTKLSDPVGQAFVRFFNEHGIKFVDADTGEEVEPQDCQTRRCPVCDNDISANAVKCNWCQNRVRK